MKVYIAGKISDTTDFKERFKAMENKLKAMGHKVLNPVVLSDFGIEWQDYLCICFAMIQVADKVYMQKGWRDSKGAMAERAYAIAVGKEIEYE